MDKKIIFQKCHLNNLYFLFYIIFAFINVLIDYNFFKDEDNSSLPKKILTNLYIPNLSDFFAIIPYLIRKRLVKKKEGNINDIKIEDNNNSNESNLIYNDYNISVTNKKKKTTLMSCIIVGILDFLEKFALILYFIIYPKNKFDIYTFSCIIPFEIICQFVCSYIILRIHFYKLQYFSLILNIGIFIIILCFDIDILVKDTSLNGKFFIFCAFNNIFYSIEYSLGKKIFLNGFISLYLLIIIRAIITLIFSILFSLIMFFVDKNIFLIIGNLFTQKAYIGLMIAKIFSIFFATICVWQIIDIFSPNYFPLSLLFYEFCSFIIEIIYQSCYFNFDNWKLYIRIFLYFISFIGVMIHNEVVVINICNLGSDTKYFLDIKVKSEELFAKTDNPEIMKRYDSFIEMEDKSENPDENSNVNSNVIN